MRNSQELIARLKNLQEEKQLSNQEIAYHIGVTEISVYRWMKGEVLPDQEVIRRAIENYLSKRK